jgi:hypothetical protein
MILPRTIAFCITLSRDEVQGGVRGDDSNVKTITVDHPVRCPSSGTVWENGNRTARSTLVGSREGVFGKCPQWRGNGMGQCS